MSPQEITDYKLKWKPRAYTVAIHSDLDWQCKDWCRRNFQRWEWSMDTYTDIYEHTFLFEKEEHSVAFKEQWSKPH